MGLCSSKIPDGDEESTTASTVTSSSEEVSSKESEEKKHSVLFGEWMKVDEKPLGRGAAYVIFWGVGKVRTSHLSKQKYDPHSHHVRTQTGVLCIEARVPRQDRLQR